MNRDQRDSLIRSILKVAGAIAIAHGSTKAASIINSEDVFGLIVLLVGLLQSHQFHADELVKAITEFAQGPAHIPSFSINQGGGSPATEPRSAEPIAASAFISPTRHEDALERLNASLAAESPRIAGEAPAAPSGAAPAAPSGAAPDGTREARVLPAQPLPAAPEITLVSFDAPPQPLHPTTIANYPTT